MTLRDPFARHRSWFDPPVRRRWPAVDAGPAPRGTPWQRRPIVDPEPLADPWRPDEEEAPSEVVVPVETHSADEPLREVEAAPPSSGSSDVAVPSSEPPKAEAAERQQLHDALRELTEAKKRVERDAQRVKDETRQALIADLLPVLDNLDRSLEVEAKEGALYEGVKLVRGQLEQVLLGYGLERSESVGQAFDPSLHEAVAVVAAETASQDGVVQAEWQAGYRFGDKVLRAAKVSVGRHAPDDDAVASPLAAE
ncbi:MAG: nucleotide exchange factor GrpE [Deltaproteobacteria bacterium]|nr:MAG: nucleotide exchange factor GrpE [Deltaproteobacteria bacterium]